MFIPFDPLMELDLSTFLQFTEGIRAGNGAVNESQVVGRERGNSVFVIVAQCAVLQTAESH